MRLLFALSAVFLLTAPAAAQAAEGDIIVVREPGTSAGEIRHDAGVELVKPLGIERTELVTPADGDVAEAIAELRADDGVVTAEVDRRATASVARNDSYYGSMWGLRNIEVSDAWQVGDGAGVTVGVVDTGIETAHVDLAGQITGNSGERGGGREANGIDDDRNGFVDDFRGWDFVSRDNFPQDGDGHGTHVAGTIAAVGDNGVGVVGVAPGAKIVAIRALDDNGSGWMSDIAAAFDYAGDLGLEIVNASLGGGYASVMATVIASHPGTLYVVAAGNSNVDNDNPATASYPCALPQKNIVCVEANDSFDSRASFSNYGATTVDVSGPGMSIRSTYRGAYGSLSGTSMATPHVAGTAALALAASPSATTSQLKWALLSSAAASAGLAGTSVTGGRLSATGVIGAITGTLPAPEAVATPEPPVATPTPVAPVATPVAPVDPVATPEAPVAPVVTPVPTAAPSSRLLGVSVAGSLSGKRGKLRVNFTLTGPATVRFTVALKGKKVATWTEPAHRGGNQVVLKRTLPTGKTLKRGAYTLAVSLSATAKQTSTSIRVR